MDMVVYDREHQLYTSSNNDEIGIEINYYNNMLRNMSFHGKDRSPHKNVSMAITGLGLNNENTQSGSVSSYITKSEYITQIDKVFSINLKKPITIHVIETLDHCLFDCIDLEIYEAGDDFHDVMMNFCQFFTTDLEYWQTIKDEELTKDALILKEKYLSYV